MIYRKETAKRNQQPSTTAKSAEKQTKNNHQSDRSNHIDEDIQLELSTSPEQLCLSQNEHLGINDLVQDDDRVKEQSQPVTNVTMSPIHIAHNIGDIPSTSHCEI